MIFLRHTKYSTQEIMISDILPRPVMSKERFIQITCQNWARDEKELNEMGISVVRCRCGLEICPGWILAMEGSLAKKCGVTPLLLFEESE
jgi:hypothetical protein